MTETPTISVVIPAYNAEAYIKRAVESVLRQTCATDDIIVVDDGSTDDTAAVVQTFGDQVRLIRQANAGVSAARNAGIQAAAGDWIAFLDADDEWLPQRLEHQLAVLRRHPGLVWVSGNCNRCYCRQQHQILALTDASLQERVGLSDYVSDFLYLFSVGVYCLTITMLIRRDVLMETGLFRTGWNVAEDLDMWFRIAYAHPAIGFVHQPIAVYHMDIEDSLSTRIMLYPFVKELLETNLAHSSNAGRRQQFIPCASVILRHWIRPSLFDDRIYDVRQGIRDFGELLSPRYKRVVSLLTICPGLTKSILQALSWLSQTLRLRRRRWHLHKRYKRLPEDAAQAL